MIYGLNAHDFFGDGRIMYHSVLEQFNFGRAGPNNQDLIGSSYNRNHFMKELVIYWGIATTNRVGFMV
jgi:hypothetical protein